MYEEYLQCLFLLFHLIFRSLKSRFQILHDQHLTSAIDADMNQSNVINRGFFYSFFFFVKFLKFNSIDDANSSPSPSSSSLPPPQTLATIDILSNTSADLASNHGIPQSVETSLLTLKLENGYFVSFIISLLFLL